MLQYQKAFYGFLLVRDKTKKQSACRQLIQRQAAKTLETIITSFPSKAFRRAIDDVVLQRFVERNERR